ncbi:DUF308 domain-containing protein [Helicobacter sp. MIT 03-1614]|jgi:uncharacterized membrane protein HdeD (DUF308 family)|uniref:DUF308 domain-containing protein n=1 Tax=Helicobacter hepaticus (strain ATCC 51449 / 3B1) TaxID=235279 RepID=Q7VJY9_HELHP|nr:MULTISPECIES: DUF308 domain-containing protein [Helicobacter]AAP76700.1 hypothetical protein HH_0103 [Helicobacter hepaticus ATCC 51449]TLD88455.1 DUF308 domain-containing protein [Helicobacter sp. MIT 03-1614]
MRSNRILWFILSLALIVLGIICIANPLHTMTFLAYFVGFIMFISGVGGIFYFFTSRYMMMLLDGVISCAFGLVLLFGGEEITQNFVPLFIALWLILKGALWLIHAWKLSRIVYSNTNTSITFIGGFYILFGVLFVLFPEILATLISLILGIILILSGGIGLYFWNTLRKTGI